MLVMRSAVQASCIYRWISSVTFIDKFKKSIPSASEVKEQLSIIEQQLKSASNIDGSRRVQLSTNDFWTPIPKHEVEHGLMSLNAHLRADSGGNFCKWLRKADRVPAKVFSLGPENKSLLVHLPTKDADRLVREYGRNGCTARIVQLRVLNFMDEEKELGIIRVKPQRVLCNAASLKIENLEFLYCPKNRAVQVKVPIRIINEDASLGLKKGAWVQTLKRQVLYECQGTSIPPWVEIDAKSMDVDHVVRVRDLPIPEGTRLMDQDFDALVAKCTTEGGDEIKKR
ncbi:hypothetical protein CEUSTIGMA_g8711.t1 [Chlamydomonas eustigma]|uniref:Large ribosomal subunit protein bL25 beta domain-containing protein n=1 Tax=Chlamydomonas eustigma TaxID=1157962 RepID=A0A250XED7_9CHLO|nr:hypothetical protein CEUSTIGMA_g8711.t1 [Chlamydomonas eustigma]|eukprot:GAX81279.1 hypothetical protein CEUSTIGMA_g8711.t1 [Chlamydomonas eustigma]